MITNLAEINTEVDRVIGLVHAEQDSCMETQGCFRTYDAPTDISGLTIAALNYSNGIEGYGHGALISIVQDGVIYDKAIDFGFCSSPGGPQTDKHVTAHDWRERKPLAPLDE
jgi:hypothetical protein